MLCAKCKTAEISPDSSKRWCKQCRKAARDLANAWRETHPKHLHSGRSYQSREVGLREIGFSSYREYLASPLWKSIRVRVFALKGNRCHLCARHARAIHHNRYHRNDLLGKTLRHVFPICDECHEGIEFGKKGQKLDVATVRSRFLSKEKETTRHLIDLILGEPEDSENNRCDYLAEIARKG